MINKLIKKLMATIIKIAAVIVTVPATFSVAADLFNNMEHLSVGRFPIIWIPQIASVVLVEGIFILSWFSLDHADSDDGLFDNAIIVITMYFVLLGIALAHQEGAGGLFIRVSLGLAVGQSCWTPLMGKFSDWKSQQTRGNNKRNLVALYVGWRQRTRVDVYKIRQDADIAILEIKSATLAKRKAFEYHEKGMQVKAAVSMGHTLNLPSVVVNKAVKCEYDIIQNDRGRFVGKCSDPSCDEAFSKLTFNAARRALIGHKKVHTNGRVLQAG